MKKVSKMIRMYKQFKLKSPRVLEWSSGNPDIRAQIRISVQAHRALDQKIGIVEGMRTKRGRVRSEPR